MKLIRPEDQIANEMREEIAERFFGFRKIIEEDKLDLEEKIKHYAYILQKRISFDLIRLYILLHQEELIKEFLNLIGLDQQLFYDPYLTESPTIAARVFQCQRFHGLTRKGRFSNYFLECYERLFFHVKLYRQKLEELRQDIDAISEEIRLYYKKNDLSAILGFLHSLSEASVCNCVQGAIDVGVGEELAKKLALDLPIPVEQRLPVLPALKDPEEAAGQLKNIARRAYACQRPDFLEIFSQHAAPCMDRDGAAVCSDRDRKS